MSRQKKEKILLDTSMTVEEARAQKTIAEAKQHIHKANILKIKALEANKSVIDIKIVNGIVTDVFTKLKSILYSATNKLPAQIVGKEHAEVTQILYKFVDDSLQRMMDDFNNKISNLSIEDTEETVDE